MTKRLSLLLCLLTLSGCQLSPTSPDTDSVENAPAAEIATPLPSRNFDSNTLYDLLLAELAGQRQQPALALQRYQRQVQQARSPLVAERAFHIAEYMDERDAALTSALTWVQLAPDNAEAHRAAALELAKIGQFAQALEHTSQSITLDPESESHFDFIAYTATHADPAIRTALLEEFGQLLQQHPQRNELRLGQAILLQEDHPEQALELLQHMPGQSSAPALALQARLLQQLDQPEQSLVVQQQLLEQQPDNNLIRLNYARQLISMNRLEEALDQFLLLLQSEPGNDDFRLGLAYLYMDLEAWQEALVYLQELLMRDNYVDTALYNSGRCFEALEQPQQALAAYQAIEAGEYFLAARQQQGSLLLQMDQLAQFTQLFAEARQAVPDEQQALLQIEVEVLSRNQHKEEAWQRIGQAIAQYPDNPNLLYTRAMLADQRDDLAQLEADLRHILHNDPEHAMAMNALGYTLADRTQRLDEALQLIEAAHQLQPDDAATLDSLGWVYYRLGRPRDALPWLEQAYAAYPDPEVAAHLGETLWALGEKRKARKLWREALDKSPEHKTLLETIKRLDPRKGWFK